MQPVSFTAASAEDAVEQIRAQLGPEAIVLNVRPLPANGLARLWQKPMIEVVACRPEAPVTTAPVSGPLVEMMAEFRQQLDELKQQVKEKRSELRVQNSTPAKAQILPEVPRFPIVEKEISGGAWSLGASVVTYEFPGPAAPRKMCVSTPRDFSTESRLRSMLEKTGMMPAFAAQVLDSLQDGRKGASVPTMQEEISRARAILSQTWRPVSALKSNSLHVLVGPAGSGKTTCLCKWLTQTALVQGRMARVWRLDGATANMAESLSVYCEILGVPSERNWTGTPASFSEDIGFIDLPGVNWRNPLAMKELAGQLKQLGSPRVHLVLNGSYENEVLLAQVRAFGGLPVEDLIVTHLDEEPRWGKIWNLILGTNYPVRHLSTGQNIPGDYCEATADTLLSRQFPNKQRTS